MAGEGEAPQAAGAGRRLALPQLPYLITRQRYYYPIFL